MAKETIKDFTIRAVQYEIQDGDDYSVTWRVGKAISAILDNPLMNISVLIRYIKPDGSNVDIASVRGGGIIELCDWEGDFKPSDALDIYFVIHSIRTLFVYPDEKRNIEEIINELNEQQ